MRRHSQHTLVTPSHVITKISALWMTMGTTDERNSSRPPATLRTLRAPAQMGSSVFSFSTTAARKQPASSASFSST